MPVSDAVAAPNPGTRALKVCGYALILVSLALGAGLTFYGLSAMPGFDFKKVAGLTPPDYLVVFLASGLLVFGVSLWRRVPPLAVGCGITLAALLICGALWPLLVAALLFLSSSVLGQGFLALFGVKLTADDWPLSTLIGAGLYATAVGLLARFPVNYAGFYAVGLILPLCLRWRDYGALGRYLKAGLWGAKPYEHLVADLLLVSFALVYLLVALMPEVGHDALAMHLFVPARIAAQQHWDFNVELYVWAVMPLLGDWLYTIGYLLGGETAVRLINLGFVGLLCLLLRACVLWAGGSVGGARWAMVLLLSTPLTFTASSSLYIESIWACYVIASCWVVLRLTQVRLEKAELLICAGLLLGFAMATKMVTFTFIPALLLVLIWRHRAWLQPRNAKYMGGGVLLALLVGLVPYLYAWLLTDNPAFPFFNHIFKSEFFPSVAFVDTHFGKGMTWDVLYSITFDTGKYLGSKPGGSGFQWVLMLVPVTLMLVVRKSYKALLLVLVACLSAFLTFEQMAYLRYVFPAVVLLAAAMGLVFAQALVSGRFAAVTAYAVMAVTVALNLLFLQSATSYGALSLPALLSERGRYDYLQTRLPIRNAVTLVNQINSDRSPVAFFADPLAAGLNVDYLATSWYNREFQTAVLNADRPSTLANAIFERGAELVILDENWKTPKIRAMVTEATASVAKFNNISVRRVRQTFRFSTELLKNPEFDSAEGWSFVSGDVFVKGVGQVTVSGERPAVQVVAVTAGRKYLNVNQVSCIGKPTRGRLQVNWLDARSKPVGTSIKVFDCLGPLAEHTAEFVAPAGAKYGTVFASSHNAEPLVFEKSSFRM
ncbi:MAG: glycosyltransferase family 39 protein [Pseudomonas sp.]|uniref:glycosyltransferase family 39 protein n=1 Tax=Pseudomonas sp. TaxID=306 RepID=UPI003392ED7C